MYFSVSVQQIWRLSALIRIQCWVRPGAFHVTFHFYYLFSAFQSRIMAKTDKQSAMDYINQMFPTGYDLHVLCYSLVGCFNAYINLDLWRFCYKSCIMYLCMCERLCVVISRAVEFSEVSLPSGLWKIGIVGCHTIWLCYIWENLMPRRFCFSALFFYFTKETWDMMRFCVPEKVVVKCNDIPKIVPKCVNL